MRISSLASLVVAVLVFLLVRAMAPRFARALPALRTWWDLGLRALAVRLPARWVARAEERILAAGSPGRLRPSGLVLSTCGLGFASVPALVAVAFGASPLFALGFGLAAVAPWIWLSLRARERRAAIARELPFVLDLLTLVVESGSDLFTGLNQVAERLRPGPLRDELVHALRELRMGRARREVFGALAFRTGSKEVGRMVAAILQAERMGAPVGESLRILATQMLSERFLLAEKRAAQAPVKLLFPLVAFIFPAVFVVLFGPIALALFAR